MEDDFGGKKIFKKKKTFDKSNGHIEKKKKKEREEGGDQKKMATHVKWAESQVSQYAMIMGVGEEEVRKELKERLVATCRQYVDDVKRQHDAMVAQIEQERGELNALCDVLGVRLEEIQEQIFEDVHQTRRSLRSQLVVVAACRDRLNKRREARLEELATWRDRYRSMCTHLGKEPSVEIDERDLSEHAVRQFDGACRQLGAEREDRGAEIRQCCASIEKMRDLLNADGGLAAAAASRDRDELRFERAVLQVNEDYLLTRMDALHAYQARLLRLKEQRTQEIMSYAQQILVLWTELGVDERTQEQFYDRNPGLGPDVVSACIAELRARVEQRNKQLRVAIDLEREEVRKFWKCLRTGDSERKRFDRQIAAIMNAQVAPNDADERGNDGGGSASSSTTTAPVPPCIEAAAPQHDSSAAPMQQNDRLAASLEHYRLYKASLIEQLQQPILKLIKKRIVILSTRESYDKIINDSSRLLNRSAGVAGRLREEERMRRIVKELPKVEAALEKKICQWEQRFETPFVINGEVFLATMQRERDQYEQRVEELKEQRKQQRNTRGGRNAGNAATPGRSTSRTNQRTPRSAQASSSSNRRTPSSSSATARRNAHQRLQQQHQQAARQHQHQQPPNAHMQEQRQPNTPPYGLSADMRAAKTPTSTRAAGGAGTRPENHAVRQVRDRMADMGGLSPNTLDRYLGAVLPR
jgi:Microtubule associated protein (MAP65/ASE1 family)